MIPLRLALAALMPLIVVVMSVRDERLAYADETNRRIDQLLTVSGVTRQLEMLGPAVLSAIPWDAFPNQRARTQAEVAVRQTAGRDRLMPFVRQSLQTDFRENDVEKLLQFYDSKLGREVSRMVGNSLDPDALRGIWEGRTIVTGMSDARRALLERLVRIEITSTGNGQLSQAVVRGLVKGFLDQKLEGGDLMEGMAPKLEAVESQIAAGDHRTGDIALAAFASTFRSLSDAELKELVAFQESDSAAWYRQALQRGLETAAFTTAATLGEALTRQEPDAKAKKQDPRKAPAIEGDPGGKDLIIGVPKQR